MVIGHAGCPQLLYHFIYLFHMPLFFFCSGLFYKPIYNRRTFLQFIKKKVKVLYVPFVKWSILYLVLHNVFMYLGIYNQYYGYEGGSSFYSYKDFLLKLVSIVFTMHDYEYVLGGFWFIRSMFLSTFLVSVACLFARGIREKRHELICSFFLFSTIVIRRFFPQTDFWHDVSLGTLGGAYYLLGYILTEKKLLNRKCGFFSISIYCIILVFTFFYFRNETFHFFFLNLENLASS